MNMLVAQVILIVGMLALAVVAMWLNWPWVVATALVLMICILVGPETEKRVRG